MNAANISEEKLNTTERLFQENEIKTNKMVAVSLVMLSCVIGIASLLGILHIIDMSYRWCTHVLMFCCFLEVVLYFVVKKRGYDDRHAKMLLISGIIFISAVVYFIYPLATVFIVFGPVMLSIKYYDIRFILRITIVTWSVYILLVILSVIMDKYCVRVTDLHVYQGTLFWRNPQYVIICIFIPKTIIFALEGFISCRIAEAGRKLVLQQADISYKAATMKNDLEVASAIQEKALPPRTYVTPDGAMHVQAFQRQAREVGGDFYDYFMLNDHMMVMLVADVSDKGLPSAMFVIEAQSIVRFALSEALNKSKEGNVKYIQLQKAVDSVNRQLAIHNMDGMFVTMWIGCIDTRSGVGKYINAGHNLPYIRGVDGSVRSITNDSQFFLGCFEDVHYQSQPIGLQKGETLILYTDGVTDARNSEDTTFGNKNLENAIANIPVPKNKPAAKYVCDGIINAVDGHIKDSVQYDDITILAVSFEGDGAILFKTLTLEAGDESTSKVVDEINVLLDGVNCPKNEKRNIGVVIDEICSNIAEYAYPEGKGTFTVTAYVGSNYIAMKFTDKGIPFNPLEKDDPDVEGEPQIGGLGIYLVKNLVDLMNYSYDKGENTLAIYRIWNT